MLNESLVYISTKVIVMRKPDTIKSLLLFTFVLWLAGVFSLESILSYVFTDHS